MNVSVFWNTVVSGSSHTIKYTIDDTYTVSFYIYKYSASSGLIEFRIINSSLRNGSYVDLSPLWQNTSVENPTEATLVTVQTALTAADVGALASGGTAVGASNLRYTYRLNGTNGVWFQFMQFTLSDNETTKFLLFFTDGGNGYQGLLNCRFHHTSGGSINSTVRWWAKNGYSVSDIQYTVDQTTETITLYIHKRSPSYILFYSILSSDRSDYKNISSYFTDLQVSEPTTATSAGGVRADNDVNGNDIVSTYLQKTETAKNSYSLVPTKVYPGNLTKGWYKFATITIPSTSGRAKITFKYGSSTASYDFIGDIFFYKTSSTSMAASIQIPYAVAAKNTYFKCNVDIANSTTSLYVYKHDNAGSPVFTIISSEDLYGNYIEPSTYMLESLVAEAPPSTAIDALYSSISRWITNVPVSIGTNQQILSYSANMITSATVLAKVEFTNPEYIKSDCLWETTDGLTPSDNGTITLTGTCTTATTANLLLLNIYIP